MLLRSDNVAGVSPEIMAAIARAAHGEAQPYGDDPVTARLEPLFAKLFDHDCAVVPVSSGIAANALGLSLLAGPLEAVVCHANAHVATAEAGSVEFFSQGARLQHLGDPDGRLHADTFERFLSGVDFQRAATVVPRAVSVTEATEFGTLYAVAEVEKIAAAGRRFGLRLHMDGARFANALVALGCRPADLTWRAGVDVLSFGATKNGTMCAEAVVVFDRALAATLARRRRRSGQMMSKMRFLSAQIEAYVTGDLWLDNARRANRAAGRLAEGLAGLPGFEVLHPVEINMLFVRIAPAVAEHLKRAGVRFRPRDAMRPEESVFRLVTSFATEEATIETVLGACRAAAGDF